MAYVRTESPELMHHVAASQYSYLEHQMVYQGHQAQSAQLQMLEAQNADLRQQVMNLQRDAAAARSEAAKSEQELGEQVVFLKQQLHEHRSESDRVSRECEELAGHVES